MNRRWCEQRDELVAVLVALLVVVKIVAGVFVKVIEDENANSRACRMILTIV
jgi:hypothetical protein